MPQIAPINWLILFAYFILCFYLFNVINYYNYTPKIKKSKKINILKFSINWKW